MCVCVSVCVCVCVCVGVAITDNMAITICMFVKADVNSKLLLHILPHAECLSRKVHKNSENRFYRTIQFFVDLGNHADVRDAGR